MKNLEELRLIITLWEARIDVHAGIGRSARNAFSAQLECMSDAYTKWATSIAEEAGGNTSSEMQCAGYSQRSVIDMFSALKQDLHLIRGDHLSPLPVFARVDSCLALFSPHRHRHPRS
ncbi:hypothetical protein K438DRAFT_2002605 [Mycena galopus ATCC 62051]|nr:hypothetical protein K438DRAFT_2002605 [Mycena galopus ATCC 62051]